uniref:FGFR1 oncogene partner (FOP) N-terminal dimerisation domain-containing protein n=1 Tax=Salmo trutta TaxID=8032 RepID=A0A673VU46_SALTR
MRAAVFLAMDEQARVENKTSLVNENLKKCLNTQDGRLVASLIIDFLQVFHIDFTLAVFQPEINSLNGLDSREQVSCDLGITETDMNRTTPLLLELVKIGRHREKASIFSAVKTHQYTGLTILHTFIHSHTLAYSFALQRDSDISSSPNPKPRKHFYLDFQEFLGLYKRFFSQCQSVVRHLYYSFIDQIVDRTLYEPFLSKDLEVEDDTDEGDSFFDDPLPKPQNLQLVRMSNALVINVKHACH